MTAQERESLLERIAAHAEDVPEIQTALTACRAVGPENGGHGEGAKAGLIENILRRFGAKPGECLMAGDRAGDIDGAHDAGVRAAGALYGYGSREELSRADYLCQTPDDIMRLALCGRM